MSVETLARRASMSPRHFARLFKQRLGTTPAAYVRRAYKRLLGVTPAEYRSRFH